MKHTKLEPEIEALISRALEEDIGDGGVTTMCTLGPEIWVTGRLLAKAAGVSCGPADRSSAR